MPLALAVRSTLQVAFRLTQRAERSSLRVPQGSERTGLVALPR